jgi:hypothetical protein
MMTVAKAEIAQSSMAREFVMRRFWRAAPRRAISRTGGGSIFPPVLLRHG